jgi:hypothetical protein
MNITLELTVEEVNSVLRSLGKHPFDEIAQLIGKIKMQGEEQLAKINAAVAATDGTVVENETAAS